jgi:hypothetical protein
MDGNDQKISQRFSKENLEGAAAGGEKICHRQRRGRGGARGLTLDNMEAMSTGLRAASEPIRAAKIKRDTARYEKMREDRAMAKKRP